MATTIDIRDLSTRIDEVLALTASGVEVLLTDGATPRARLVPCAPPRPRVAGLHAGAIRMAPDFDEPLPASFWLGTP